ncbi:DMT family transporter [Streptomyces xiamenensis]|uniref:DMT family transporter n=1 Tax=Streptomyces xiamenensis TaxID=408015 RepID=UPI003D71293E
MPASGTRATAGAPPTRPVPAVPGGTGLATAPRLDIALLALAVLGIGLSGPLITAIAAPALAIAFWRNALATAALVPAVLLRPALRRELRRTWGHLPAEGWGSRTLVLSALAGAVLAAHFALWLPSLGMTSVASSVALVTTTPIWTILLLRLRGHRPPAAVWLGVCVAFTGALLLTGVDLTVSARALAGDALALAGGMAGAVYVLIGAEVRRTTSTTTYTFLCYSTTAALLLPVCLIAGAGLGGYSGETWLKLLLLTATAQLLGHSLMNRVVRGLGPSVTSTAILLEAPIAALIAGVWLSQRPEPAAYPALAMILAGLALVVRAENGRAPVT